MLYWYRLLGTSSMEGVEDINIKMKDEVVWVDFWGKVMLYSYPNTYVIIIANIILSNYYIQYNGWITQYPK